MNAVSGMYVECSTLFLYRVMLLGGCGMITLYHPFIIIHNKIRLKFL